MSSRPPVLALPRFVVLRSFKTRKVVQYVDPDPVEDLYLKQRGCGLLRADGDDVLSSYAKFELEAFNDSTKGKPCFRLRSCYNNKYVVAYQKIPHARKMTFVAGGTGGPVDELSLSSSMPAKDSTMMKTDPAKPPEGVVENGIDDSNHRADDKSFGYSLFEYELTAYLGPRKNLIIQMIDTHNDCIPKLADDGSGDILAERIAKRYREGGRLPRLELIEVIDWETLMAFPKHVAFKGDNGKYLIARDGVLEFSGEDRTDEAVVQEVVSLGDGTIRIKSILMDKFWGHIDGAKGYSLIQPQHFHPENEDTYDSNSERFEPVKLTDNIIALRKRVGNNDDYYFCKRLHKEKDRLAAATTRIDKYARFTVEEVVLTKSFYDVEYRLDHVRVYNESTVSLATQVAANKTNEPQTTKLTLEYTLSRTSNWSTTTGWNAGVSVSASSSFKIPFIGQTSVEVSASYEYSSEDVKGGGDQNDTKIQTEFQLTVPPNTSTKVSLMATKGSYDIPFHYTNRDTISDGSVVINRNNDGVFTGTDCYNFRFDITEYPLGDSMKLATPAAATK